MPMIPLVAEPRTSMRAPISFRPLERSDFPRLQKWLSAPHVAAWWNDHIDLGTVEAKYGPRVDGTEPTHVFVIEQEGRPIGWTQWYLWSDYPEHAHNWEQNPPRRESTWQSEKLR
jgi:hypothetical protein